MRVVSRAVVVLGVCVMSLGCQPAVIPVSSVETNPVEPEESSQPVSTRSVKSGVAIINLNEIARQLGETQRWQAAMTDRETELNERLELMKISFEQELADAKAAMGEELSEEQTQELKTLTTRYNTSILQEREHARGEYVQFQAGLETEFRKKIRPIALKVAQESGYAVVMQHNAVFDYDASADITVRVIERLQGSPDFAATDDVPRERLSGKLPGGGQFRPLQ